MSVTIKVGDMVTLNPHRWTNPATKGIVSSLTYMFGPLAAYYGPVGRPTQYCSYVTSLVKINQVRTCR